MIYLTFLRGINVGGHNKIKMADLREALTAKGFQGVKTYIQSGNICLKSSLASPQEVAAIIQQTIQEHFGLNIKSIVKTPIGIGKVVQELPEEILNSTPHNKVFAMFLDKNPEKNAIDYFLSKDYSPDWVRVGDRAIFFACPDGISKSKLNNNWIEKQLKVNGTTRNYKTLLKILSLVE